MFQISEISNNSTPLKMQGKGVIDSTRTRGQNGQMRQNIKIIGMMSSSKHYIQKNALKE
jgi:hypothetical protein